MQASGGEGQSTVMEQFALADASETPRELLEREEPLSALLESLQAATLSSSLAKQLAAARIATAKYATNLGRAKADGYGIITRMIPSMGWHYMNPKVTGFDVRKPPILVYLRRGAIWQLGALEWVFPKLPAKPPIQGARYGVFGAACHYVDGTFVVADARRRPSPAHRRGT
jgi:hypothetical protein